VCEKHINVAIAWLSGASVQVYDHILDGCWVTKEEPRFFPILDYRVIPRTRKVTCWVGTCKEAGSSFIIVREEKPDPDNCFPHDKGFLWTQVEVDEEVL
jgi:hypothetical protein